MARQDCMISFEWKIEEKDSEIVTINDQSS